MGHTQGTGSLMAKSAEGMQIFLMVGAGEVAYSTDRNWRWGYEDNRIIFSLHYF